MLFRKSITAAVLLLPVACTAQDDPFGLAPPVKASLVAEQNAVVPGQPFAVALKMEHSGMWHTYWINPGSTGVATTIKWKLPEGFTASDPVWPVPHVKSFIVGDENFGRVHYYEGTIYILTDIKPPADLKTGDKVTVEAAVTWLHCDDTKGCFPGKETLKLTLPVADEAEKIAVQSAAFDAVRKEQPSAVPQWKVSVTAKDAAWIIRAEPAEGAAADPGAVHFLDAAGAILGDEQVWKKDGMALVLEIDKKSDSNATPWGYIQAANSWVDGQKLALLPVGAPPAATTAAVATPDKTAVSTPDKKPEATAGAANLEEQIATIRGWGVRTLDGEKGGAALTWPLALLFAFLGGIILNLMPCVFPVLGIKILGFVRQSGEDHVAVKKHGLVYAIGILASMLVLAGILLALRAFGELLGWGFQLQNPVFLMCLIVLVFAVALELTGVFELGTSLTSVGAELQDKSGYKGSFFSGLLTVLLATPCTGPFMGPALGFALSKDTPVSLVIAVFILLSFGLALPYVILSYYPALVKKLPRPGAWMETFKQVMSFPMFATCAWMITIFASSTGNSGLFYLLFALTLIAMALWLYGRFGTPAAKPRSKRIALPIALLCVISGGWLAWQGAHEVAPAAAAGHEEVAFSPDMIIERRAKGQTTVVDFWARWCLVCESNKKLAFSRDEFITSLKKHDAIFMLADWTKPDERIEKFLAAYQQGGIPFAIVVPPTGPVIQLPTALPTPSDAIRGLEEAKKQAD